MNMKVIFASMNTTSKRRSEDIAWKKKVQACTGFEPMTSADSLQCSTNWANKLIASCLLCFKVQKLQMHFIVKVFYVFRSVFFIINFDFIVSIEKFWKWRNFCESRLFAKD